MLRHIKTLALILLGASALFLAWRTWIYDGSIFQENRAETETYAPKRLDYSASSSTPAKCAVMRDGRRTGAQADEQTAAVYDSFKPELTEALERLEELKPLNGTAELLRDGVFFEYPAPLPLELISVWLSADAQPELMNLEVRGIGLLASGGLLFLDADGVLWRGVCDVGIEQWPPLPELPPCSFAFEAGHGKFEPVSLLIEGGARPTAAINPPPDVISDVTYYAAFLENLGLSPLSTPFIPKATTRVYVDAENGRSCEISSYGTIIFTSPAVQESSHPPGSIAEDVLAAWDALAHLHPAMGGAVFEVLRVTPTQDGSTVEFALTAGRVPLLWEPAVVEVRGGVVRTLSLNLCRVDLDLENPAAPLSLSQAVALMEQQPNSGAGRLELRYTTYSTAVEWVTTGGGTQ